MITLSPQEISQVSGGFCPCFLTACTLAAAGATTSAAAFTANMAILYATSLLLFGAASYFAYKYYYEHMA